MKDNNHSKALNLIKLILTRLDGGVADYWKVYKLLYFIDFENYSKTKKSITGYNYYNWKYGPLPYKNNDEYKDSNINLIKIGIEQKLWTELDNKTIQIKDFGDPLNGFDVTEQLSFDNIMDRYSRLTGSELVALSYEDTPYLMTELTELIDYDYVFWRESKPDVVTDITDQILNNPKYVRAIN